MIDVWYDPESKEGTTASFLEVLLIFCASNGKIYWSSSAFQKNPCFPEQPNLNPSYVSSLDAVLKWTGDYWPNYDQAFFSLSLTKG